MNNRRTFGSRYAAGGGAGMNRQGAVDRTAIGINKGAPVNPAAAGGGRAMGRATFDNPAAPDKGRPMASVGQGMRNPAARVERLQNRLERRGEKIRDLKSQIGQANTQSPTAPIGGAAVDTTSTATPQPVSSAVMQTQTTPPSSQYGGGQPPLGGGAMTRPAFDKTMVPPQFGGGQFGAGGGQGGYGGGQMGGMGGQQDMIARDRSIYGRPIGGGMGDMSGYGQMGGYGDMGGYGGYGGYGGDMGGYGGGMGGYGDMGGYGQMGGYGGDMGGYGGGQGGDMGGQYQDRMEQPPAPPSEPSARRQPPANRQKIQRQIRRGVRQGLRQAGRPGAGRPGAGKAGAGRTNVGRKSGTSNARVLATRGKGATRRRADGGVVMRGGGLARKGVGVALKGGGLARKGVGMALAKGGAVRKPTAVKRKPTVKKGK